MKKVFKAFFSTSNEINENTVMGVLYAIMLIVSIFAKPLEIGFEVKALLGGMALTCFGLSLGKK
ncbi:MAG: hypothetical protein PF693_14495 [Spirochaetia bacterium]|jgi:hypothetical protein|nr:hypothetical protein [Spirochaetia bacterium]